jgi:hypothetical protein
VASPARRCWAGDAMDDEPVPDCSTQNEAPKRALPNAAGDQEGVAYTPRQVRAVLLAVSACIFLT